MKNLLIKNERIVFKRFLVATVLIFILTSLHHVYGAVVYNTPWRTHIIPFGTATLFVALVFLFLYQRYNKKAFLLMYVLINLVFFGLAIGVFEGFYNHVLKNLLYFSGLNFETWRILFPAPTYEVPGNLFFEITGILQFPLFLLQVYSLRMKV